MIKNVLATIAGFIVASIVVYIFETLLGQSLFPLAEGSPRPEDMEWLKANMHKIPLGSKVFVVIAHFMGILCGMAIAGLISKTSMIPSYIVAGLMILATVFATFLLPKNMWFIAGELVAIVAGFFFGKSQAQRYIYN